MNVDEAVRAVCLSFPEAEEADKTSKAEIAPWVKDGRGSVVARSDLLERFGSMTFAP